MDNQQITIFISYSHDSKKHQARVLSLSDRLITEGIDCDIDRYVEGSSPEKGWPNWMEEKLRNSDYVLVVCSEGYLRKCEGREKIGKGLGGIFESILVIARLYENGFVNKKFIPIVFDESDSQFIPAPLRPFTRYNMAKETDYTSLYRRLTNQIEIVKPPLGDINILPSAVNLSESDIANPIEINGEIEKVKIEGNDSIKTDDSDFGEGHKKLPNDKEQGHELIPDLGSQFIMIEDEVGLAQTFVRHLNISDLVSQVAYISDIETLSNFILETNHKRIFWVDLNLGIGRETEGLEMIKIIREYSPDALIIVYTAYQDTRETCLAIGADNFFLKAPGKYEKTLSEIRNKITTYLLDGK